MKIVKQNKIMYSNSTLDSKRVLFKYALIGYI